MLLDHLPPESALKTAERDALDPRELAAHASDVAAAGYGPWSHEATMLAEVCDRLAHVAYVVVRSQGGKAKPSDPYPRPGVVPKVRRRQYRTDPEAFAVLEGFREQQLRIQQQAQAGPEPGPPTVPGGEGP